MREPIISWFWYIFSSSTVYYMQPSVEEIFPKQDMSRYVPATPTLPPLHSKTLCSALNWLHQRQKSTNYYFQMEVSLKNWGVKKKISKIYWIYWMVKSLFFFHCTVLSIHRALWFVKMRPWPWTLQSKFTTSKTTTIKGHIVWYKKKIGTHYLQLISIFALVLFNLVLNCLKKASNHGKGMQRAWK